MNGESMGEVLDDMIAELFQENDASACKVDHARLRSFFCWPHHSRI